VLLSLWSQTQWVTPAEVSDEVENAVLITTTLDDGSQRQGVPEPIGEWEYLLQELTQAVYEAAQREHPLQIRYLQRSTQGEEYQLTLRVQFLDRTFMVTRHRQEQIQQYNPPWAEVKPLLSALYQLDYHREKAYPKMPQRPGQYIDPGDGLWYLCGQALTNPGRIDQLDQIIQIIGSYLEKINT
jgi:head-tail adaptor